MSKSRFISIEEQRQVREEYEMALLGNRVDLIEKIESLYRHSSFWGTLEKIKREIKEALIA